MKNCWAPAPFTRSCIICNFTWKEWKRLRPVGNRACPLVSMKIPPDLLAPLITAFYRLWCATLRINEVGREVPDALWEKETPMVIPIWHDELFTLIHVRKNLKLVTVVSQSRDGEYLARLLESLRIRTARGSSSRGGIGALLKAARIMREEGRSCVITVDGPRGPRHEAKQGAVILAHRVPALVQPIRLFPERAIVFRSWDRFQLPVPFSRVHIVFGEPYSLRVKELTEETLEAERIELERRLEASGPPPGARQRKRRENGAV